MPEYVCESCEKKFKQKSHYKNHLKKKYPCIEKKKKESLNNQIGSGKQEALESEIKQIKESYEKKLEKLEEKKNKEIKKLIKEKEEILEKYIKKIKPTKINYKISVVNYIQKNYPNAPELKKMEDFSTIFENENSVENLAYKNENKTLVELLGKDIIEKYKKKDPSEQSIWVSDVSRLTYVVKELLWDKKSIWNKDIKGVRTEDYLINPMLEQIRKKSAEYLNKKTKEMMAAQIQEEREEINKKNYRMATMMCDTNIRNLKDEIKKYIAPYFTIQGIIENPQKAKQNSLVVSESRLSDTENSLESEKELSKSEENNFESCLLKISETKMAEQ